MMNYMQWFSLLGRETALVRAELTSIVPAENIMFVGAIAIGNGNPPPWDNLGGVIRAGEIIGQITSKHELPNAVAQALPKPLVSGKVSIGLSSTALTPRELRTFGKSLKASYAQIHAKRPRIVFPQTGTLLNTGHVQGNRLLTAPNCEVFLIKTTNGWLIGKTHWQQDIVSYTSRDRERPARDAKVGMLPPKLAQTMLNLAGVTSSSHIHDPFCGTGVILTEALIKHASVSGSDASGEMVQASRENIAWMQDRLQQEGSPVEIFQADAQTVQIPAQTTHIVSEGYLGNPDLRDATTQRLREEAKNLIPLYRNFFQNLSNFPGPLTIVFALPVWFSAGSSQPIHLPILDDLPDMGYTVEQFAPDSATTLIYHRPHQTVGRAIIKLRKG